MLLSPVVITLALVPIVIVIFLVVVHKLPIVVLVVIIEFKVLFLQRARHARHTAPARATPPAIRPNLHVIIVVIRQER